MNSTPIASRVTIDLDAPGPAISRHLYGHFAEHLGRCIYGGFWVGEESDIPNQAGIRLDVVEALRELAIPNLRWPGGCFADYYHWREGIGPREERPRMVNSRWGDVVEHNHFGTHEFLALCELLGAEPYVNGNVGSGTVQEMSEWVEYLTRADDSPMSVLRRANGRELPWRVPFWGIGNEPWGCGGNMRVEAFVGLARQFASFCRDQGDNRLYRIVAGARDDDYAWTDSLMRGLGPFTEDEPETIAQAISFHYYTAFGKWRAKKSATEFSTDDYYATMVNAVRIDEIIRRHSTVMDAHDPDKRIGLVLDEWGTWWSQEAGSQPGSLYQQNTMRDALVASVHFDAFHRNADRLVMANIAQTVNVLQAMVLTDPATDALILTPTYHVFAMNKAHHDANALDVRVSAPEAFVPVEDGQLSTLSASASTRHNQATVSITNLDADRAAAVTLDLRGRNVRAYSARILTAPTLQSHNSVDSPNRVSARDHNEIRTASEVTFGHGLIVEVPPHSYVTVKLDLD